MAYLHTPPGLPSILAGILNLRGTAVPVLRLELLFGMPETEPALHTPLIILKDSNGAFGLLVEKVDRIISLPPDQVLGTPETDTFNGCAIGATDDGSDIVHVLSVERILIENERRVVNEFREVAQARIAAVEAAQ